MSWLGKGWVWEGGMWVSTWLCSIAHSGLGGPREDREGDTLRCLWVGGGRGRTGWGGMHTWCGEWCPDISAREDREMWSLERGVGKEGIETEF